MLEPSSEWTEIERLAVIKAKKKAMKDARHADHQHRISPAVRMAHTQQLHLLAHAPAAALEGNREDLLAPVEKLIDDIAHGI